jgi:hypothetical protein
MDSKLSLVPHGATLPSRAVRGRACVYERRGIRDLHALAKCVHRPDQPEPRVCLGNKGGEPAAMGKISAGEFCLCIRLGNIQPASLARSHPLPPAILAAA